MSLVIPEGITSNGHVPVWWMPTKPADLTKPSLATDLNAAIQLDCYLVGGGVGYNNTSSTKEQFRLCMTKAATVPGAEARTITLEGVYDGQNRTPEQNELFNSLKKGQKGTLYIPWGYPSTEPLTVGTVVDVTYGEVGSANKNNPVKDEDLTVTIEFLAEQWEDDVAIVA